MKTQGVSVTRATFYSSANTAVLPYYLSRIAAILAVWRKSTRTRQSFKGSRPQGARC